MNRCEYCGTDLSEDVVEPFEEYARPHTADRLMRTLNLVQFASETGGVTTADVDSHLHAGLRSALQTKTYRRWFDRRLRELQAARDATQAAYEAAVVAGEIAPPPELTLEERASGHPDNASVQAARRLLAKRKARLAAQRQSVDEGSKR